MPGDDRVKALVGRIDRHLIADQRADLGEPGTAASRSLDHCRCDVGDHHASGLAYARSGRDPNSAGACGDLQESATRSDLHRIEQCGGRAGLVGIDEIGLALPGSGDVVPDLGHGAQTFPRDANRA